MFERLTYWNEEYGCWSYRCASGDAANRLAAYEDSELTPEEVHNLAKAQTEGWLVELPCKVGGYGVFYPVEFQKRKPRNLRKDRNKREIRFL